MPTQIISIASYFTVLKFFSDEITSVEVMMFPNLDSAFVKMFIATIHYLTEREYYHPVTYKWFFSHQHINDIIVITTSPLLNQTFADPGYYQYILIVYNDISRTQTSGSFTGQWNYYFL